MYKFPNKNNSFMSHQTVIAGLEPAIHDIDKGYLSSRERLQ
jgi:hypothetical protein